MRESAEVRTARHTAACLLGPVAAAKRPLWTRGAGLRRLCLARKPATQTPPPACSPRSALKGLEHLGTGWIWIPAPVVALLLAREPAVSRAAAVLLACMVVDIALVGLVKVRCAATFPHSSPCEAARLWHSPPCRRLASCPLRRRSDDLARSTTRETCTLLWLWIASRSRAVRASDAFERGCVVSELSR